MARRQTQPKELVRLSPLQFSLSVSIVVVLLGAAGLTGYFYGLKQASRTPAEDVQAAEDTSRQPGTNPDLSEIEDKVTFYKELKEPRKDVPQPEKTDSPAKKAAVPVASKVPEPQPSVPAGAKTVSGSGSVLLQVASYREKDSARKLLGDLSHEGYAGTVVRADLDERGVWFRVRIGPYREVDAKKILSKLREERKLKGYIVK